MERGNKLQPGVLKISEDVIATVARLAATEIPGVENLTFSKVNFKQIFVKPNENGAIKIKLSGDVVEISLNIIVKFGYKVIKICEEIQQAVKTNVQSMTGVTVSRVNISVVGIAFNSTDNI